MLLYVWGILFNLLALILKDADTIARGGLLQGYDFRVVCLLINVRRAECVGTGLGEGM